MLYAPEDDRSEEDASLLVHGQRSNLNLVMFILPQVVTTVDVPNPGTAHDRVDCFYGIWPRMLSRAASTASTARVRLLTLADVPAVRKVCEGVYGGADYLPLYICSWIKAKNFVTLGLELENTLVKTFSL